MATFNQASASAFQAEKSLSLCGNLLSLFVQYNDELDGYYLYAKFEKGTVKEQLADPVFVNDVRVFWQEVSPKEDFELTFVKHEEVKDSVEG